MVFRKQSTVTKFLNFTTDIVNSLIESLEIQVGCTAFHKAFDKINHYILLNKLFACGITKSMLK